MIGFSNINWISIATSQIYPISYDYERYSQQHEITRISAKHSLNITKKVLFYLPLFSFISKTRTDLSLVSSNDGIKPHRGNLEIESKPERQNSLSCTIQNSLSTRVKYTLTSTKIAK